jgi:hypothetical protein
MVDVDKSVLNLQVLLPTVGFLAAAGSLCSLLIVDKFLVSYMFQFRFPLKQTRPCLSANRTGESFFVSLCLAICSVIPFFRHFFSFPPQCILNYC